MKKLTWASFNLTIAQNGWLTAEASRLGISRAELLRRLVDKWRGAEERRDGSSEERDDELGRGDDGG